MDSVLNPRLDVLLARTWLTPYIAYERVRQTLMPYFVAIKSVHFQSDEEGKVVIPLTPRLKPDLMEYLHFSFKREPELGAYIVNAKLSWDANLKEETVNELTGKGKLNDLMRKYSTYDDGESSESKQSKSQQWMRVKNVKHKLYSRTKLLKPPVRDKFADTSGARGFVGNYAV